MTDGLQEGARMREELEVKLLEAREYIEKLEQRECSGLGTGNVVIEFSLDRSGSARVWLDELPKSNRCRRT